MVDPLVSKGDHDSSEHAKLETSEVTTVSVVVAWGDGWSRSRFNQKVDREKISLDAQTGARVAV